MNFPLATYREPRFLELGLFPPYVANHLSLDSYAKGHGLMVGDVVTIRRRFFRPVQGIVVGIHKLHLPRGKSSDRFLTDGVLVNASGKERYYRPSRVRLARRPTEYRPYWIARYERDAEQWRTEAESDPLEPRSEYEESHSELLTGIRAQSSLCGGLDVAYSGQDDGLAQALFRRVIVQADRYLEGKSPEPAHGGIDSGTQRVVRNRQLTIRRARALAAAILGEPFDTDCLLESARFWAAECTDVPSGYWDDQHKLKLIRAAMWAMIAGEPDYARELLASKRSFRNHRDHLQLLRKMVRKTVPAHKDHGLVERCRTFFDFIRHPTVSQHRETWYSEETAVEWALLMAKVIDRQGEDIDWRGVIDAVSR